MQPTPTILSLFTIAATGCMATSAPVLRPEANMGPGGAVRPTKTLAMAATCGSAESECPDAYIDIVDGIVRSSLEFKGYALVLPEQLNAQNLDRQATTDKSLVTTTEDSRSERRGLILQRETVDTSSTTTTAAKSSHVVITGSTFADLSVADRALVMQQAGADSIVVTRIVVGAMSGVWTPSQNVEVMAQLSVDGGNTVAWAVRCTAPSGSFGTAAAALEGATRCAMSALQAKP
ncbi:MAG: hypothetical protein KBG15_17570 [Kofleriaceae bacterium]|nr:hypothetical protein [Kofleriaceae bacterium]